MAFRQKTSSKEIGAWFEKGQGPEEGDWETRGRPRKNRTSQSRASRRTHGDSEFASESRNRRHRGASVRSSVGRSVNKQFTNVDDSISHVSSSHAPSHSTISNISSYIPPSSMLSYSSLRTNSSVSKRISSRSSVFPPSKIENASYSPFTAYDSEHRRGRHRTRLPGSR
eukprot:CAMPEP_0117444802 /NCGR_PEP_ID=MMETSP0759-20121206/5445_1 /TAXON_ID=63605 /ORGANISM="Percolomonas cosmopolitus, Strain WS" /LENGTH=168 /DNA_ID=CAMNT_0005236913 /DNA_START=172 /DNA_END=678 /DNA_ORIENTATION=+